MSLRLSRSQSLLRILPSQSLKRGASGTALFRTQNASHLGQTQLTSGHARRFKSIHTDALKITQGPVTGKPTSISDIEVRLGWSRSSVLLTPVVASQIGGLPEGRSENSPKVLGVGVWRKFREFCTSECFLGRDADDPISDGPHVDHPMERHFWMGDPKDRSMCVNLLCSAIKKTV